MLPFSMEEFFVWNKLDIHELKPEQVAEGKALADDYMRNGGYPEVVVSRQLVRSYLDTLFDSIVWKDVAKQPSVLFRVETYRNIIVEGLANTRRETLSSRDKSLPDSKFGGLQSICLINTLMH
jgi:predicted AAA+ superfamily ATPase